MYRYNVHAYIAPTCQGFVDKNFRAGTELIWSIIVHMQCHVPLQPNCLCLVGQCLIRWMSMESSIMELFQRKLWIDVSRSCISWCQYLALLALALLSCLLSWLCVRIDFLWPVAVCQNTATTCKPVTCNHRILNLKFFCNGIMVMA